MSFHKSVRELIENYGSTVEIKRENETVSSKAFIQPLRYRSSVYKDQTISMGGFSDGRYYLYLGQAENEFSRADNAIISCNGKKYTVHTSESFELFDESLYVWAVLLPYKQQRQDDYDTD